MSTKDDLLDAAMNHALFDGWSQATIDAARADLGLSAEAVRRCFRAARPISRSPITGGCDAQMVEALRGRRPRRDAVSRPDHPRRAAPARDRRQGAGAPRHEPVRPAAARRRRRAGAVGDRRRDLDGARRHLARHQLVHQAQPRSRRSTRPPRSTGWATRATATRRTWEFLDRRIENVMQFEKVKAQGAARTRWSRRS